MICVWSDLTWHTDLIWSDLYLVDCVSFNMGLTITSLFSKLFGKKQMRILMGEYFLVIETDNDALV